MGTHTAVTPFRWGRETKHTQSHNSSFINISKFQINRRLFGIFYLCKRSSSGSVSVTLGPVSTGTGDHIRIQPCGKIYAGCTSKELRYDTCLTMDHAVVTATKHAFTPKPQSTAPSHERMARLSWFGWLVKRYTNRRWLYSSLLHLLATLAACAVSGTCNYFWTHMTLSHNRVIKNLPLFTYFTLFYMSIYVPGAVPS